MIRQDYLLRLIEQCAAMIARVLELRHERRQEFALEEIDRLVGKLIDLDLTGLLELDEAAIQARLLAGDSSFAIREKTSILAAALHQAGEIHETRNETDAAYHCHLKALNLLLGLALRDDQTQVADFVPKVGELCIALRQYRLPLPTQAALMHHYECLGAFDKAEDTLHRIRETDTGAEELLEWGAAYYRRLLAKSDEELIAGGLSRDEVETGLAEWIGRADANRNL